MSDLRVYHSATVLRSGKVLVSGGWSYDSFLPTATLYDPAVDAWASTGSMSVPREAHTATLLASGKVLVAGGENLDGFTSTAELYDPETGTWSPAGSISRPRGYATATALPSGKVLIAGGLDRGGAHKDADLYDPALNTWLAVARMLEHRRSHTATLLPSGKVLIAGGWGGGATATAELYDPVAGTWSATGAMAEPRYDHTATLLPSGKVLVAGGRNESGALATAEVYDPATGTWTSTAAMREPRTFHSATLVNGRVLVAGGEAADSALSTAELYEPGTGSWSATSPLLGPRMLHAAVLLNTTGQVLALGGRDDGPLATAERYDPCANGGCSMGSSCKAILASNPGAPSGIYPLDPCGTGASNYYCDMETAGGGWTVAGWQSANASTNLGVADRGTVGSSSWSKDLACVSFKEILVFNRTYGQSFAQVYPQQAVWSYKSTNMAHGTAGNAFKQGVYGGTTMMGCVGYSYNGGVHPGAACDNDYQAGARGHLAWYAGEYCSGGRLDGTWAWSDGSVCRYRGQMYTWGFAIR